MSLLKKLFGGETELRSSMDQQYWDDRAKKFGKYGVINLSYGKNEFDKVTQRDEDEIFPVVRPLLTGKEKMALDFGCGPGRFTRDLAGLISGKSIGVDSTKAFIKQAPRSKDTEYRLIENGRIPLPDSSVDLVWTFNVLGCIKDELLPQTVAEIERVLVHGGIVVATENSTEKENVACYTYRQPADYIRLFKKVRLKHVRDFLDKGQGFEERLSIIAGKKTENGSDAS